MEQAQAGMVRALVSIANSKKLDRKCALEGSEQSWNITLIAT
jgi:hypothetical protein